jgi:Flp pilus assembly protein TadG
VKTKTRRSSLWREAARQSGGGAAVEFALILPVLLTMLFAMLVFGIALNNYLQLTFGVREAARQFSISRGATTPWSTSVSTFTNGAPSLTTADVTLTFKVNGTTCSSDGTATSGCEGDLSTAQGLPSSVTATYPCNLNVGLFNPAPSCTLSTTTTELVE